MTSSKRARLVIAVGLLLLAMLFGASYARYVLVNNAPNGNATGSARLIAPTATVPGASGATSVSAIQPNSVPTAQPSHSPTGIPSTGGALGGQRSADWVDRIAAMDATRVAVDARRAQEAATSIAARTSVAIGARATPYTDIVTGTNGFAFVPAPRGVSQAEQPWLFDTQLMAVAGSAANDVWAVGYFGLREGGSRPIIEHWDGKQWSMSINRNSPDAEYAGSSLLAVSVVAANDAWAVGGESTGSFTTTTTHPLALHWNGLGWERVPALPAPPGVRWSVLSGISGRTSDDYWAVGKQFSGRGDNPSPLVEHWDGNQWSIIPTPDMKSGELTGVVAIAHDDVWAVGEYMHVSGNVALPRALIEHWDGAKWAIIPGPGPDTGEKSSHLQAVSAHSEKDVWAVGWRYISGQSGDEGLIEHWDGVQWRTVPGPKSNFRKVSGPQGHMLAGVSALAPDDVWAVGYYGPNDNSLWYTLAEHWDGREWSVVPSPNAQPGLGENGLRAVAALGADDVWAVGEYGNYEGDSDILALTAHYGQPVPDTPSPDNKDSQVGKPTQVTSP